MQLNDYQNQALGFRLPSANEQYVVLNLAAEAGEISGKYAKMIRDGKPFSFEQDIKKELGDVLWHVAVLAADLGFSLEDIAYANAFKLSGRKERGVLNGSGDDR